MYILKNNKFQFDLTLQQHYLYNQDLEDKVNNNSDLSNKSCFNSHGDCDAKSFLKFVEVKNRKYYGNTVEHNQDN